MRTQRIKMQNMENYDKLVNEIYSCDLIVHNEISNNKKVDGGKYQYIGFYYDKKSMNAPSVVCKSSSNDCISMILILIAWGRSQIYSVTDDRLTKELIKKISPGDCLPEECFDTFAKFYGEGIKNRRKIRENWSLRARKYSDILNQINLMKTKKYRRAEKNFLKKEDSKKKKYIRSPTKYFENGMHTLSEKYNLELFSGPFLNVWFGSHMQKSSEADDYRLTGCFIPLHLHVLISPNQKKIYIYDNCLLRSFNFSETQFAFGYYETLVRAASTNVKRTAIKYFNEYIKQFPTT